MKIIGGIGTRLFHPVAPARPSPAKTGAFPHYPSAAEKAGQEDLALRGLTKHMTGQPAA